MSRLDDDLASTVAGDHGGNDRPVEVGLIGREGVTGLPLILGNHLSTHSIYMQVAGEGHRVAAQPFREALETSRTHDPAHPNGHRQ